MGRGLALPPPCLLAIRRRASPRAAVLFLLHLPLCPGWLVRVPLGCGRRSWSPAVVVGRRCGTVSSRFSSRLALGAGSPRRVSSSTGVVCRRCGVVSSTVISSKSGCCPRFPSAGGGVSSRRRRLAGVWLPLSGRRVLFASVVGVVSPLFSRGGCVSPVLSSGSGLCLPRPSSVASVGFLPPMWGGVSPSVARGLCLTRAVWFAVVSSAGGEGLCLPPP